MSRSQEGTGRSVKSRQEVGKTGEDLARWYLEGKGYRFIAAHYCTRYGEIDLVMDDRGITVFVEVKTRMTGRCGCPEESVTGLKRNHLVRAALMFIKERGEEERLLRFDVVSLTPGKIHHIPDAFMAGDIYYY